MDAGATTSRHSFGKSMDLTPVHIRLKRPAGRERQRKRGRPRKARRLQVWKAPQEPSNLDLTRQKVKLAKTLFARLEDLPTEVLEVIFVYSRNLDFPLTSSKLAAQLNGPQIQRLIMDDCFSVLLESDIPASISEQDCVAIESVISRRFCTWDVMKTWLHRHFPQLNTSTHDEPSMHDHTYYSLLYSRLCDGLNRSLEIPFKLLCGPYTDDKIQFLRCFKATFSLSLAEDKHAYERVNATNAIQDAILNNSPDAMAELMEIGLSLAEDSFHVAVFNGCDEEIVNLVTMSLINTSTNQELLRNFDALDSDLWSWAEQPKQIDSGAGDFVKSKLRDIIRAKDLLGVTRK